MNTDWRWWRSRYVMRDNGGMWLVWDSVYEQPADERLYAPADVLDAYREAIKLNEMEIEYGKQPA